MPKRSAPGVGFTGTAKKEGLVKRSKAANPLNEQLSSIEEAVCLATHLNAASREMLRRCVRTSLESPAQERHAYQAMVGKMVKDALVTVATGLSQDVKDAEKHLEDRSMDKELCKSEITMARLSITTVGNELEMCKHQFCMDNVALQSARRALDVVEQAEAKVTKPIRDAIQLKFNLESALLLHHVPLIESDSQEAEKHLAVLLPLLEQVPHDESLRQAIPIAAQKRRSERGFFDNMVLNELGNAFRGHTASLAQLIAAGDEQISESNAKISQAENSLAKAQTQQMESAKKLRAAEMRLRGAEAHRRDAELEWESHDNVSAAARASVDAAKLRVQKFESGPLAALDMLLAGSLHNGATQTIQAPADTILDVQPSALPSQAEETVCAEATDSGFALKETGAAATNSQVELGAAAMAHVPTPLRGVAAP